MNIFILIVVLCFVLMHLIDMLSFGSRVAGRVTNRAALGTTLQLTIMTLSKFFLVPFLPLLGYLVESGINIDNYLILVILSYSLCFFMSVIILLKLNIVQCFFQKLFTNYHNRTIPSALLKTIFIKNSSLKLKPCKNFSLQRIVIKKTLVSCFAYIFIITGFFAAFMSSALQYFWN